MRDDKRKWWRKCTKLCWKEKESVDDEIIPVPDKIRDRNTHWLIGMLLFKILMKHLCQLCHHGPTQGVLMLYTFSGPPGWRSNSLFAVQPECIPQDDDIELGLQKQQAKAQLHSYGNSFPRNHFFIWMSSARSSGKRSELILEEPSKALTPRFHCVAAPGSLTSVPMMRLWLNSGLEERRYQCQHCHIDS